MHKSHQNYIQYRENILKAILSGPLWSNMIDR